MAVCFALSLYKGNGLVKKIVMSFSELPSTYENMQSNYSLELIVQ